MRTERQQEKGRRGRKTEEGRRNISRHKERQCEREIMEGSMGNRM